MPQFTRSKKSNNGRIRKKRLQKNFVHRFFGTKNLLPFVKKILKGKIILASSVFCMLGFILFALFSPYFSLQNIKIESEQDYPRILDIQKHVKKYKQKNLFLLSKKKLNTDLKNTFPEIESVNIQTIWPKTIHIKTRAFPAVFNIVNQSSANKFAISKNGTVLKTTAQEGLKTIKIEQYENIIKIRDTILTPKDIETIEKIEQALFSKLEIIPASRTYLYQAQELHIQTKQDQAVLWIDLQQDIHEQINKLVLAEKRIKFQSKKFHHIDLRIPNQIFWEWK